MSLTATATATATNREDQPPPLKVWEGGGDGIVASVDHEALAGLRERWEETSWDLESRWQIAQELFAMERNRVGLSEDWKVRLVPLLYYSLLPTPSQVPERPPNDPPPSP